MLKKTKLRIGTRLVPSIENIEGCHKWGGIWDRKDQLCYKEEEDGSGCTAPYKGIRFCWGAMEYEDFVERPADMDSDEMEETYEARYRPEYFGELAIDGLYPFFNSHEGFTEWPDEDYDRKDYAIADAKEWALEEFAKCKHGPCYNPRGKPISCDEPNAIACANPEDILRVYQKRFFREKPFDDRWFRYSPSKLKMNWKKHPRETYQIKID